MASKCCGRRDDQPGRIALEPPEISKPNHAAWMNRIRAEETSIKRIVGARSDATRHVEDMAMRAQLNHSDERAPQWRVATLASQPSAGWERSASRRGATDDKRRFRRTNRARAARRRHRAITTAWLTLDVILGSAETAAAKMKMEPRSRCNDSSGARPTRRGNRNHRQRPRCQGSVSDDEDENRDVRSFLDDIFERERTGWLADMLGVRGMAIRAGVRICWRSAPPMIRAYSGGLPFVARFH